MIVVLAGGVGAARFLQGLVQVVPQNHITVIGNTNFMACMSHLTSISSPTHSRASSMKSKAGA